VNVFDNVALPRSGGVFGAMERARAEIGRVRGWTSHGAHERAAKALDRALAALDEAERLADHDALREAVASYRADLDRFMTS
jgi:hypothetical protein